MAAAIHAIPDGAYSGERGLDNDGIEMDRWRTSASISESTARD